jgi:archaellum component FlaC
MQTMTQGTTDERLDRLEEKVDEGFAQVDDRFKEVDNRFHQVDIRLAKIDLRLEAFDVRFELFDKRMSGIENSLERLADGQVFIQKVILAGSVSLLCAVIALGGALIAHA